MFLENTVSEKMESVLMTSDYMSLSMGSSQMKIKSCVDVTAR